MSKIGRPLRFETPSDLESVIQSYFEDTLQEDWTVTGLCLHCGMTKTLLNDYEEREGYSDLVKLAKLKVEHSYELSLRRFGRTGDIFALKNFGWKDKSEVDQNNKGEMKIEIVRFSDADTE